MTPPALALCLRLALSSLLLATAARGADGSLDAVPNRGQWPLPAQARMVADDLVAWLEPQGWTYALRAAGAESGDPVRGHALRLSVLDARSGLRGVGEGRRPGRRHWLRGRDPAAWVRDVPAYAQWRWPEIRPGVDLVAHSSEGRFEYDLLLAGEARLEDVIFRIEGADAIRAAPDGGLLVSTPLGELHQAPPIAFSLDALGQLHPVPCHAQAIDDEHYRFVASGRLDDRPLVVDPEVSWSSFLGGSNVELSTDLVANSAGVATLVGTTAPGDYPVTAGVWDPTPNGKRDAVVTRLAPDGDALVFSTLIGGFQDDEIFAAADDGAGGLVLAGFSASPDFPITPGAHDDSFGGGGGLFASDGFVAHLSADGSDLLLSTYVGGSQDDLARAVVRDAAGIVYVAGNTRSPDLPLGPDSADASFAGGGNEVGDAFVAAYTPAGALLWGRYLGGAGDDLINALAFDENQGLWAAGWSSSPDAPTTPGAWSTQLNGSSDALVARLDPQDGSLLAATLLGGTQDDNALALSTRADGGLDLVGTTRSADFPLSATSPQASWGGGPFTGDVMLARLSAQLDTLLWSGVLGGSGDEFPIALEVDSEGGWVFAGWTTSADLQPTRDALALAGGGTEAFVARVDPQLGALTQLSVLGGSKIDKASGLALLPDGELLLAGFTTSASFPVTSGAYDTSFGGIDGLIGDAFLMRLDLELPTSSTGWESLGFGLPGAAGAVSLQASGTLSAGASGVFQLENAQPDAPAFLLLGTEVGLAPLKQGTLVPSPIVLSLNLQVDGRGAASLPYLLPGAALPSGLAVVVQAWVADPGAPAGWAASEGLRAVAP